MNTNKLKHINKSRDIINLIIMNLGLLVIHAIVSFIICLIGIGFNALVFSKLPTFTIWAIVFVALIIVAEVVYFVYVHKEVEKKQELYSKIMKKDDTTEKN